MRHTQFWDKRIKVHRLCCSLFRNDMHVMETLCSLDCHRTWCGVKQAHPSPKPQKSRIFTGLDTLAFTNEKRYVTIDQVEEIHGFC
jgi:hypothetical protein